MVIAFRCNGLSNSQDSCLVLFQIRRIDSVACAQSLVLLAVVVVTDFNVSQWAHIPQTLAYSLMCNIALSLIPEHI